MSASVSSMNDGEHSLTLTTTNGDRCFTARDRTGKVLFDGPVDKWEQRRAMPEAVLKKLEKLWKSCATIANADSQAF